jgi:hypothetical protein
LYIMAFEFFVVPVQDRGERRGVSTPWALTREAA